MRLHAGELEVDNSSPCGHLSEQSQVRECMCRCACCYAGSHGRGRGGRGKGSGKALKRVLDPADEETQALYDPVAAAQRYKRAQLQAEDEVMLPDL